MNEEGKITMTQFKTVVEDFNSKLQSVIEVMQHGFTKLEAKIDSHSEQIAILVEGQTEIKAELRSSLKERVTYQDFNKLNKRVARLERKTA